MALTKIVSGGQTGVDRGSLDAALGARFPCGGWCPADRAAEDGPIPARHPLTPLARGGYPKRARQNVLDSDGTAILFNGVLGGGTPLTLTLCKRGGKPHVVINASKTSESEAAEEIARFVEGEHQGFERFRATVEWVAGGARICLRRRGEAHPQVSGPLRQILAWNRRL
jgi:hypothetical protein